MNTQKSLKSSLARNTSSEGGFVVTFVADIKAARLNANEELAIAILITFSISLTIKFFLQQLLGQCEHELWPLLS